LTALFAQASVAGFDGVTSIPGGWLDHHYIQLAWHIADSAAGFGYSFAMTVSQKSNCSRSYPSLLFAYVLDGWSLCPLSDVAFERTEQL